MKNFFKVTKGRRVKEYADEIKEAAVRYGYKYGWTAAAIKYGTSSTSVSRWATYDDPKSPWKLKVKKCFFSNIIRIALSLFFCLQFLAIIFIIQYVS